MSASPVKTPVKIPCFNGGKYRENNGQHTRKKVWKYCGFMLQNSLFRKMEEFIRGNARSNFVHFVLKIPENCSLKFYPLTSYWIKQVFPIVGTT